MSENSREAARPRSFLVRFLIFSVLLIEGFHLLATLLLGHPVLTSNLVQLLLPLFAVGVILYQRTYVTDPVVRRCWISLALAFAIWSAAQTVYIYFLFHPAFRIRGVRPDDALWMLFGLPILLALNTTHEGADHVQWLDRAQTVLFFIVLYLLILMRPDRMSLGLAFLTQNLALFLCCLLRLPTCTGIQERRFFLRLTIFLALSGLLDTLGDVLHAHGWQNGGPADLIWTLPVMTFIVLTLRDSLLSDRQMQGSSRLAALIGSMQGLSISSLTFLSLGLAALLATRQLVGGGALAAGCFAVFALRTNARELGWHHANKRLEDSVETDALTGLGNRVLLRKCLKAQMSLRSANEPAAVLIFADLDRFKSVNDSLGHVLGDELLVQVAHRLRRAAQANSVICRQGGDEFVIVTTAVNAEEALSCGQNILQALRPRYQLGEHLVTCTASIGVVMATEGESPEDLLRTADQAMYHAKKLGRDRVQFFNALQRRQMSTRWHMESDLRRAVEQNQIQVAFQPILNIVEGKVTGFEALARWTHGVYGSIPPSKFIRLAEESGLIGQLAGQIAEKACRQVAEWNRTWNTPFSLSINVSPRQLTDSSFVSNLLNILHTTRFPPELLLLEITESALLINENAVRETLSQVRRHGIRISLDDFGTRYSSLAFLLSLPVDELKIDRSFVKNMVADPAKRELVNAVVKLGRSFDKRVVAEGIEAEAELSEIVAMGCDLAQGWLIARPERAEIVEAAMPSIQAHAATMTESCCQVDV